MIYIRGRLIASKYIIFNRGIRLPLQSYRQHFHKFVDLAFDFIKIVFSKIQLAFELFPQNRDSNKICY